jgi:hypothetical protein
MVEPTALRNPLQRGDDRFALRFTPAEWRMLLEDRAFLADKDNRYLPPRRLMGVAVEIVPDHRFG